MIEVLLASAREQLAGLRAGSYSTRELMEAHLRHVEAVNPADNAVVSVDGDRAMRAAAEADARRRTDPQRRLLDGLPISFKDTHATEGMRTTLGSPLHADWVPDHDDEIVRRLRAAGALAIGKTNVPEFAAGSHTFNPVFGTTVNPYDVTRSAGGSSGGAAAALALGMQPIADGSDLGGSIRNPASFCNVVGLRPTPGRVPDPAAPMQFPPLSTGGPMARTVGDVALLLAAMAGPHPHDATSLPDAPADLATVDPGTLSGLRVAWAPDLGSRVPVSPAVTRTLRTAVEAFAAAGAHVEPACPDLDGADSAFRVLRAAEFELLWGEQLDARPDAFKPDLAWNIREGRKARGLDVARAVAELTRLQRAAATFFDAHDVLLAPVTQVEPFPADLLWPSEIAGRRLTTYLDWMASCYLITTLGVPAISVPAGFTEAGLPVGLQIVGRARSERFLLGVAAAFEAATGHGRRRPPLL